MQRTFFGRFRSIATVHSAVVFVVVFTLIHTTAAVVGNYMLITSSLSLGKYTTAFSVTVHAFTDLGATYNPLAWFLGLALISINIVLMERYIRKIKGVVPVAQAGLGIGATLVFTFGLGCVSCGAIAGIFLASLGGASSLPSIYLWGGQVFLWGGLGVLVALTAWLFKKVTDPLVC